MKILEKLSSSFLNKKDLINNFTSYTDSVIKSITLPSLKPLKKVISDIIIKKIATEGITFENLLKVKADFGTTGVIQLFKEKKSNGKPKITGDIRALNKISHFFNKY